MTLNTNEDFRSQFNSDWTNKLIIAVDEALLDRREDSERIKNLSTAMSFKAESKGKDRNEVDFFAKFILNSNNEYRPIIIDQGETRYWVRKVSPLQKENDRILGELKAEIPHFLYFLLHRDYSTKYESRMWFRHDLLITDALRKIIQFNRGSLEIEMLNLISEIMQIKELDTYTFCVNDMLRMLKQISIKTEPTQIRAILKDKWSIAPGAATRYVAHLFDESSAIVEKEKVGRIYYISREQIERIMLHC